ncbi:hypothetical protein A3Q56_02916 [Intoshia linei]|uniref:Uncharacterized protein n=1 Tax=Intoshia linei TaxID=1819745 RepID=A0A177B4T1_9BILA|nr:hypothetical protein A3Q56_02916 [Intoshia linei]
MTCFFVKSYSYSIDRIKSHIRGYWRINDQVNDYISCSLIRIRITAFGYDVNTKKQIELNFHNNIIGRCVTMKIFFEADGFNLKKNINGITLKFEILHNSDTVSLMRSYITLNGVNEFLPSILFFNNTETYETYKCLHRVKFNLNKQFENIHLDKLIISHVKLLPVSYGHEKFNRRVNYCIVDAFPAEIIVEEHKSYLVYYRTIKVSAVIVLCASIIGIICLLFYGINRSFNKYKHGYPSKNYDIISDE